MAQIYIHSQFSTQLMTSKGNDDIYYYNKCAWTSWLYVKD